MTKVKQRSTKHYTYN